MNSSNQNCLEAQWYLAHGDVTVSGILRASPDDFIVNEQISFEPSGDGQHVYLKIRKRELNTRDVIDRLARVASCKSSMVGYAGLKDRNAVTTQWFSVDLAGKSEPDWDTLNANDLQVLDTIRHNRKLKVGAITANHFNIIVRQLSGITDTLDEKLELIHKSGVPNYFGEQRFGHDNANVIKVLRWFAGECKTPRRQQRSMLLSAARSWLFNNVLSERVTRKTWDTPTPGDVMSLRGSRSVFVPDEIDEGIVLRCRSGDICPTGPLWGKGELTTSGDVRQLEMVIAAENELITQGLEKEGLQQQRRALRVFPDELQWQINKDGLELSFQLPSGSYATAVLREVVNT